MNNYETIGSLAMLLMIARLIVRLAITHAVWIDSNELQKKGQKIEFLGPHLWIGAVMVGGIIAAGIYWLIHHSSIKPVNE